MDNAVPVKERLEYKPVKQKIKSQHYNTDKWFSSLIVESVPRCSVVVHCSNSVLIWVINLSHQSESLIWVSFPRFSSNPIPRFRLSFRFSSFRIVPSSLGRRSPVPFDRSAAKSARDSLQISYFSGSPSSFSVHRNRVPRRFPSDFFDSGRDSVISVTNLSPPPNRPPPIPTSPPPTANKR